MSSGTAELSLILNWRKAKLKAEASETNDDADEWKWLRPLANHSTETMAKWEAATFVTVVWLQLAGDTFQFSTATMLFISIIKTMLLDSVFHHHKPHHLLQNKSTREKKSFLPGSPGLEAFFQSINNLAKAFQLEYKHPTTLNRTLSLLSPLHFTAMNHQK